MSPSAAAPRCLPGAANPSAYVRQVVNAASEYIAITADVTARPANINVNLKANPARCSRRNWPTEMTDTASAVNFIGAPATDSNVTGTGIFALDKITDVSLIAIPGQGDVVTVNAGIDYCKNMRPLQDCFFIGDMGTLAECDAGAHR